MGGFCLSETCRALKHRCHRFPQGTPPLRSSRHLCSDHWPPDLLPKSPFEMLCLWIKQVKPTQTQHPDSRHWGAWGKPQLPGDTPQGYSIFLTCQHVSAGSLSHRWSSIPAHPRRGNEGAAWTWASSPTPSLPATDHTHTESRNFHQLKSFFESRWLLADPKNVTYQHESVYFSKETRQVAQQMLCRKSPRRRGATCQPSIASSQRQPFSAWGAQNGSVLLLPAVSQTLKHPTDTSLSALQLFKESLSVYY